MIFVLAPTFQEAEQWARDNAEEYGLTFHKGWKYLTEDYQLNGSGPDAKFVVLRSYLFNQKQLHLVIAARARLGEGSRL